MTRALDKWLIVALVVCHMVSFSPYMNGVMPNALLIGRYVLSGIIAVYCIFSLRKGAPLHLLVTIFIFSILVFQQFVYSHTFSVPVNLNALSNYAAIGAIVVFAESTLTTEEIIRIIAKTSIAYCAIFSIFHPFFASIHLASAEYQSSESASMLSGRIPMALGYAGLALAFLISQLQVRRRLSASSALALLAVVAAFYLSFERVFLAVSFIAILALLIPFAKRASRVTLGLGYAGVMFATLCFVFTSVNPFESVRSDHTGHIRYVEYLAAHELIQSSPITGIGIASSLAAENQIKVRDPEGDPRSQITVYANDIGPIGLWLTFGIFPTILLILGAYLCCTFRPITTDDPVTYNTLITVGLIIGGYNVISHCIAGDSGTLLFGLILADQLAKFARLRKRSILVMSQGPTSPSKRG